MSCRSFVVQTIAALEATEARAEALRATAVALWAFFRVKSNLCPHCFELCLCHLDIWRATTGTSTSGTWLVQDNKAYGFLMKLWNCLVATGFTYSAFNCISKNSGKGNTFSAALDLGRNSLFPLGLMWKDLFPPQRDSPVNLALMVLDKRFWQSSDLKNLMDYGISFSSSSFS